MIIKLHTSRLFTVDPAIRFGKEYGVSPKIWHQMWKRHLFHEYDVDGLCGYFLYKTGKKIRGDKVQLWIFRSNIYVRATHIINMGQRVVDSSYFNELEDALVAELTRNMLYSGNKDSRIIV